MSVFYEDDFRTTLLNRAEIEKILGVKITNYNSSLEHYALSAELPLEDVVCIFLGEQPKPYDRKRYPTKNPNYEPIYNSIAKRIEAGEIQGKVEDGYMNEFNDYFPTRYFISHDTARQIATTYNYKWNVPPFKTLEPLSTTDHSELLQQLTAKDDEIARLKAEIEQLKQGQEKADIVDYKQCSIHGHYSENIEIIFRLSKQIAEKCDVDNPHSYPEKKHIAEYVKKYHSDNGLLSDAIYKIITPGKVKNKGRPPKGVETFQGFS